MTQTKKIIIIGVVIAILTILTISFLWPKPAPIKEETNLNVTGTQDELQSQILAIIADYSFNISEIDLVEKIKSLGPDVIPILAELINDPKKETRYISYITLSGLTNLYPDKRAELISYLKNGLTDSDPTIKVQVAQLLIVWGEKDSVPILIEGLDSKEMMIPSEPPTTISFYAHMILVQFTDQDFGYAKDKWQDWWDENKDQLKWQADLEKFK